MTNDPSAVDRQAVEIGRLKGVIGCLASRICDNYYGIFRQKGIERGLSDVTVEDDGDRVQVMTGVGN